MDVSRDTVHRWMTNYKKYGMYGLENDKKAARSKLSEAQKIKLKVWIQENPKHTLQGLALKYEAEFGLKIGKSSIHRVFAPILDIHI